MLSALPPLTLLKNLMRTTLHDYLEKYPELGNFIPAEAATRILLGGENGEVYWANSAFLEWIGYSINEFTRGTDPVTWKHISVNDASLQADIEMSREAAQGGIAQYKLRKFYVPKNQKPELVELFVRRFYPNAERDFVFFIVEVFPMNEDHARFVREQGEFTATIQKTLESLDASIKQLSTSNVNTAIRWLVQHPIVGGPASFFLIYLLFGEKAIEIFSKIMTQLSGLQ